MLQTLKPIEAAELVHDLFSDFDTAVKARGLLKMDTVGDAYIVAGFLPAKGEGSPCFVCRQILEVNLVKCFDLTFDKRHLKYLTELSWSAGLGHFE